MPEESEAERHGRDLRRIPASRPLARTSAARTPAPRRRTGLRRAATLITFAPIAILAFTLTLALVYSVVTPPSTLMLGRWLTLQGAQRDSVPLEAIAPALVQAVMASEDQRFCLHNGVDWGALREVVDDEEGPSRGASTITMQTVKNVFLWPGRSYIRKGLEIPLAVLADAVWGKRRTMEIYLNVAEWGRGSSASRPPPAIGSARVPATCPGARPRSSPRSCRTRSCAAPASRLAA